MNIRYLDAEALEGYIAALEGGLRESGSTRSSGSKGFGGGLSAGPAKLDAQKASEVEEALSIKDHHASRLQRLIDAGASHPDSVGWIDVNQPDVDFKDAGTGAFIAWECDIYIPETIAAMSRNEGLASLLGTMRALLPNARALGLDVDGIPDLANMDAVAEFLQDLDVAPVVIGEDSDTNWKTVGSLRENGIRPGADFEDRVRIVGKVKRRVPANRWYPLLSLPGMNLMSREDRRQQERQGPRDASEEKLHVKGPLLVLDYLAIYN